MCKFFLVSITSLQTGTNPAFYSTGATGAFPGGGGAVTETDRSPSCSCNVKRASICTSAPSHALRAFTEKTLPQMLFCQTPILYSFLGGGGGAQQSIWSLGCLIDVSRSHTNRHTNRHTKSRKVHSEQVICW